MTAPDTHQPEPHFDHELERLLFMGMLLLVAMPLVAWAVYVLAARAGVPRLHLLGVSVGAGIASTVAGAAATLWNPAAGRRFDAALHKLGLSSWGFPTAAVVLAGEVVYRRMEADLAAEMLHWAEWAALGALACVMGCRAFGILRRRRPRRAQIRSS